MVYYDTSENTNAIEEETKSDEATLENDRESKQFIVYVPTSCFFADSHCSNGARK